MLQKMIYRALSAVSRRRSIRVRRNTSRWIAAAAWVERLESRAMLAAAATFQFKAIASDIDPTKHIFGLSSESPYTLLRGGIGTMQTINGFPQSSALAGGVPSKFTFSFGAATASDPSALKLTSFDNGLSDGIAKQVFTKTTGNVNTLTVFLSGTAVAKGTLESLTVKTNTSAVSTGLGVFKFTSAVGNNPTVFNELKSISGGTGLLSFKLGTFSFSGAPTSYGEDASLFASNGSLDAQAKVNAAPVGTAKTVTTLEDVPYVFKVADFGFTDPKNTPPNTLLAVKVTKLPSPGSLTNNGVAVTVGARISVADITAGKLKFTPMENRNGATYSSFTFQVQDNGGTLIGGVDTDTTPRKMTVAVTPINDAPTGTAKTISALKNVSYVFRTADFGFNDLKDTPANSFLAVKVMTLPLLGSLNNNGVAVIAGDRVLVSDIVAGKLKYTPPPNGSGSAFASLKFRVQDNGGTANGGVNLDAIARKLTISVI